MNISRYTKSKQNNLPRSHHLATSKLGEDPTEVSIIFYFPHFNFRIFIAFIYLLAFKNPKNTKSKKIKYDKNKKNIHSTLICDLGMFSFYFVEMMSSCSIYNSSVPKL